MLNLYKYHMQPLTLNGYRDRFKLIPELAYYYALREATRLPEYEPAILKETHYAILYAKNVIHGRWSELEDILLKRSDAHLLCDYASDIIKGRWPEAEPIIMKNYSAAYSYAYHVIRGRWKEAEPYIMKDAGFAYYYAKVIIKGRWPEAEQYIQQEPVYWKSYKLDVRNTNA